MNLKLRQCLGRPRLSSFEGMIPGSADNLSRKPNSGMPSRVGKAAGTPAKNPGRGHNQGPTAPYTWPSGSSISCCAQSAQLRKNSLAAIQVKPPAKASCQTACSDAICSMLLEDTIIHYSIL